MGRLETRFGVNIGYGDDGFLKLDPHSSRLSKSWTLEDLKDIRSILETIPESHLLFTPLLREIQRVPLLAPGVLGARYENGVIKIADSAFNHAGVTESYEGISSLRIVLMHEIGHGIQIGRGSSWVTFSTDGTPIIGNGEDLYDFSEFLKIGGWRAYEKGRVREATSSSRIFLDDKELPLGQPIDLNGEQVVLKYFKGPNILMSYRGGAEFSHRDYSHASPWEDFAEAFAEYMFLPKRLIKDAPEKFRHLDQEFRRYHGDSEIQRLLSEALQDSRTGGRSNSPLRFDGIKPATLGLEEWVL
jgi:hypothetical protein